MNRRDFISRFSKTAAAAGVGVTATAAATYPKVRQGVISGARKINGEMKALTKRIDAMENSHRKMVKMLIVAVSLSTGLDALTLLKGDPL